MLASCTWNFLCHKTAKGLLKHWITTYFISYLCAVLQCDLHVGGLIPAAGWGLMKHELSSGKILSKKERWDNSKRNKGWGRSVCTDCSSLLVLIAPHCPSALSCHNSFSTTSVSACRHALQTEHLGWAAQRAWLSFAEGVAAPACLCPPSPGTW